MPSNSVSTGVETWNITVNQLNRVWMHSFPSIIAKFWLVTNSKEQSFIAKDLKKKLTGLPEHQLECVFGRGIQDLLNLHPFSYEDEYPFGDNVQDELLVLDTILVELYKFRKIINNLYKGLDRKLTDFRKNVNSNGKDNRELYEGMSELKFKVDSLCNSLERISVRMICMSGLVLTEDQDIELRREVGKAEVSIDYLKKRLDSVKHLIGRGKVLYDEDQKNSDVEFLKHLLIDGGGNGFYSIKVSIEGLSRRIRENSFQANISNLLSGHSKGVVLTTGYHAEINDRLCYDLIYTNKGIIFPWPTKPESSLLIFDLYMTRESGSSAAISIPGFNLSVSSNTMVPVRKSLEDINIFDRFDQKCSQIEEVIAENKDKYCWQLTGSTFSRLQMALPRVIASIWGDQDLYNQYASVVNTGRVKQGRGIMEIEQEVLDYIKENELSDGERSVSREWLLARGANVRKLKNRYYSKVYSIKELLDELEIGFATWLGLLKDGVPPEISDTELAEEVNHKLIKIARSDESGMSMVDEFRVVYEDYWEKIVSSLSRSRYKMKNINFHFDIWNIPEVIVLVDCIHNDLSYVTKIIEDFRKTELGGQKMIGTFVSEKTTSRDSQKKSKLMNEMTLEIQGRLEAFFEKTVEETTDQLGAITEMLNELVDVDEEAIDEIKANYDQKYKNKFSKFVRDQSEISLPEFFEIEIIPVKVNSHHKEGSEVVLSPSGLRMPFPLRPNLEEIYQSWAHSESGIPTFTNTMGPRT